MSRHRADLRAYVFAVARELVERGTLRRAPGQTVSEVVRAEARQVAAEVWEDFIEVGREVGILTAMSAAQADRGSCAAASTRSSVLQEFVQLGENRVIESIVQRVSFQRLCNRTSIDGGGDGPEAALWILAQHGEGEPGLPAETLESQRGLGEFPSKRLFEWNGGGFSWTRHHCEA